MDPAAAQELEDAQRIIRDKLEQYGLGELADFAYEMLVNDESTQAVMDALQETDAFKQRFAGMEARRQAGLPAFSPADYIRLENNYRSAMTQQLLGESAAVTSSELAAAEFGLDSEATSDIAKLRQQRQQRGRRQAGALMARSGVSGLGRAT